MAASSSGCQCLTRGLSQCFCAPQPQLPLPNGEPPTAPLVAPATSSVVKLPSPPASPVTLPGGLFEVMLRGRVKTLKVKKTMLKVNTSLVADGCQCFFRGLSQCYCPPKGTLTVAQRLAKQTAPVEEPAALTAARKAAREARDARRVAGGRALVDQWREVSKAKKQGPRSCLPAGCKLDFPGLFQKFLEIRGLSESLRRTPDQQGWAVFEFCGPKVIEPGPKWEKAFHGTWWYAMWGILKSGVFLASDDHSLGHDFWEPGVYCSPSLDTGLWYARPQILFGDGVYYRIIFELRVDTAQRKQNRKRGGIQWVFPDRAVALHGMWVRVNAPPKNGEERVDGWETALEAVPPGLVEVPAVVNPNKGPWPHMEDPYEFDKEGSMDAPPWLQEPASKKKKKGKSAAEPPAEPKVEIPAGIGGTVVNLAPIQPVKWNLNTLASPLITNGGIPGVPAGVGVAKPDANVDGLAYLQQLAGLAG